MGPTMDALVLHGIGDIRLERVPRPQPGPGEALVRVAAVGVCGSDLPRIYEHGAYHYPLIPGHEIAGVGSSQDNSLRNLWILLGWIVGVYGIFHRPDVLHPACALLVSIDN